MLIASIVVVGVCLSFIHVHQDSSSQNFIVDPGRTQLLAGPGLRGGNVVTIHLAAASPVDVAFLPDTGADRHPMPIDMARGRCLEQRVIQGDLICELPPFYRNWVIAVQDKRTPAGVLGAGVAVAVNLSWRRCDNLGCAEY